MGKIAADDEVAQMLQAIKEVKAHQQEWFDASPDERLAIVYELIDACEANLVELSEAGAAHRGDDSLSLMSGAVAGPGMYAGGLNTLVETFTALRDTGEFPKPVAVRKNARGQTVVQVGPRDMLQKMVIGPGGKIEVVLEDGVDEVTQGAEYFKATPGCAGILGAGNFEAPSDLLFEVFIKRRVAIYKHHVVQSACPTAWAKALEPLTRRGVVRLVEADIPGAQAMIHHEGVTDLIMTGSNLTYDAIVWGPGAQGEKNKKSGNKKVHKPFCAELGNCSPYIVAPGTYTTSQLLHHADALVAAKQFNGGHICVSPQLVVTDKNWPQREEFIGMVRDLMEKSPKISSYYPGFEKKVTAFKEQYPDAEIVGQNGLVFVHTDNEGSKFARYNEAFAPVLVDVAVDFGSSLEEFLPRVTDYCNDEMWGTLACTLIVPEVEHAKHSDLVDQTLADLPYGSIGLNVWGGMAVDYHEARWGAHPGHTAEDIQSGMSYMHNFFAIDNIKKAIVTTAFVSPAHQKALHHAFGNPVKIGYRLVRFKLRPTYWRLISLLSAVLIGL